MGDRTYNKAFEVNRAAPVFLHIEDASLNSGSGGWRPFRTTDTSTIDSLNISGIYVNTDELESIGKSGLDYLASGNQYSDLSNQYLNLANQYLNSGNQYLNSGNINTDLTNQYILLSNQYLNSGNQYLNSGNQYLSLSNQYLNSGNQYLSLVNQYLASISGDIKYLRTGIASVNVINSITSYPPQGATVSNTSISGGFTGVALITGVALLSNSARKSWFIANTSNVSSLYVAFGAIPVSASSFNLILNPSSFAGQQGGSWSDSPAQYTGAVSVSGQSFICWEI